MADRGDGPQSVEGLRKTLQSLLEIHGFEMFVSGLFNADPHPGNLIAMPDGRVGLIDYGQCKRLEPGPRHAIAELMVKIADDAPAEEVAAAFRRVGVRTEKGGDEFLSKMAVRTPTPREGERENLGGTAPAILSLFLPSICAGCLCC